MVGPVSGKRKDGGSSFRKLKMYLLFERDPETGKELLRGDFVASENVLDVSTIEKEMLGVARGNPRVKDSVYHYQICWQPGERPSREQWVSAAKRTLKALGFAEHQYLLVAHDDKKPFHVHVMVNRVHPVTYRAHMPRRDYLIMDETLRYIEHEQRWRESPGTYRWDPVANQPVRNTREEMAAIQEKYAAEHARGKAIKVEHYQGLESLQSYAKGEPARDLQLVLARHTVTWQDVHATLYRHGLELDKAEHGGYTVKAVDSGLRVKASDVFRKAFAGKANRLATEQKLGPWEAPNRGADQKPERRYQERPRRDLQKRQEQREEREKQRREMKSEFRAYRAQQREIQKEYTQTVRDRRKRLYAEVVAEKKEIRARPITWKEKRALISILAAETVAKQKLLTAEAARKRSKLEPKTYQQWVLERAEAGDKRAASQLRGWRYQDQRIARKSEDDIAAQQDAAHLGPPKGSDETSWKDLTNDRLKELQRNEELAKTIAATRWKLNRRNGDVTYVIRGEAAIVDRGRVISVLNSEEATLVLGLEMAAIKFGPVLTASGPDKFRRSLAVAAARNKIDVQFADAAMQRILCDEKERMEAHERNASAPNARLRESIDNTRSGDVQLEDRAAAEALLNTVFGHPRGTGYLQDLENRMELGSSRSGQVRDLFKLKIEKSLSGAVTYDIDVSANSRHKLVSMLKDARTEPTVAKQRPAKTREKEAKEISR